MKAITYSTFGSADVLQLTDLPEPHIGPDSMVVEVRAVGLNPVDYKIREGYLEGLIDINLPAVPGWDVSGVVVKPGLDTPEFKEGDEVFAYARKDIVAGGTLAERVAVPARTAAHKPRTVSHELAAAVPLAGLTALQMLRRAGVGEGSRVLIHGASGGVGSFGVQIAKAWGAHVVGTASARNHTYVCDLGAEHIEYGDGLIERAAEMMPHGYDAIVDFAGGESLEGNEALLAPEGVVASIADARAATDFDGIYGWVRPDSADLTELARMIDAGDLRIEVARTYPLAEAADAYRELEGGHVRGKIVVTVS
ncbi:NADP-dependent oxidoreductase [Demequina activiva]|uniref:NADPH:quinone reductase n=1 Tax=Demequina activiva TaxID=1582364 RepID=A0A919UHC6_9MICO|nr:NADP-dependent oxidoreductase [Demequina activiva]GIG55269.1 NADPH:quinone reductase [Demequina activiva]